MRHAIRFLLGPEVRTIEACDPTLTVLDWLRGTVLSDGKISAADLDRLVLTDDVDEAVALMVAARDAS